LVAVLVDRALFADEDEARRWVMAGQVLVDDRVVDKPGTPVAPDAAIRIRGRQRYAGRGGYKLATALEFFQAPVVGRIALDCGASTGGFTDCLLQHGAVLVYAVEAGYGQLLGSLRANPRVRNLERTNLGDLTAAVLDPLPALVTLDLSYLSLTAALPQVAPLLAPLGDVLALFKPLFEVANATARRTGAVDDPDLVVAALVRVLNAGRSAGLHPRGAVKLALRPRHGVHEYVLHFSRTGGERPWRGDQATLEALVRGDGVGREDAEGDGPPTGAHQGPSPALSFTPYTTDTQAPPIEYRAERNHPMSHTSETTINALLETAPAHPVALEQMAIRLHPSDDVVIAKQTLAPGTRLRWQGDLLHVRRPVPAGHKVALRNIAEGEPVRRYGQIIGFATQAIAPGDHVHTQNLGVREFARDYAFGVDAGAAQVLPATDRRTFEGYVRADGRVGTRNYIAVIPSVNCSSGVVRHIMEHFDSDALHAYPHVDGVIGLTHKSGCGSRYASREILLLQRTLAGFAHHPCVAAAVIVGLGCEINQVTDLVQNTGLLAAAGHGPIPLLVIQDVGGSRQTIEAGIRAVEALLPEAEKCRRTTVPVSELTLALQCGGSDGWSGVTANPALGYAADLIVRQGGTVALGETTEVYGAEHMLTRRASSRAVGEKLVERIRWWEDYTARNDFAIDNNPSPGNKAGGLTTIYEKSLGAVAKGGTTPLNGVYEYAEPITTRGFVHIDTPGYDPVSVTGQVASGCNIVAFTTGRGSVFGFKPAPSIKIATNATLYEHMVEDMDINAGRILDGVPVEQVGREIFEELLAVASGKPSKSERNGMGDEEFNPWILGAVL